MKLKYSLLFAFLWKVNNLTNDTNIDIKYYIGGNEAVPIDQREKNSIRARHLGAEMLGMFYYQHIQSIYI